MFWRLVLVNLLNILARCMYGLGSLVHIAVRKLEGIAARVHESTISPAGDLPATDLRPLFGSEELQYVRQVVKGKQTPQRRSPVWSKPGSPPKHWLEYVQGRLPKQSEIRQHEGAEETQLQTGLSRLKKGRGNVPGSQYDTAEVQHGHLRLDTPEYNRKLQQRPFPTGQTQEKSETDAEAQSTLLEKQQRKSNTTTSDVPSEQQDMSYSYPERTGYMRPQRLQPAEEVSLKSTGASSQHTGSSWEALQRSSPRSTWTKKPSAEVRNIVDKTSTLWQRHIGSEDKPPKGSSFRSSASRRQPYPMPTGLLNPHIVTNQDLGSPSMPKSWLDLSTVSRTEDNLTKKDAVRCSIVQNNMERSENVTAEPGEHHWPALPDIHRYLDEQAFAVQEWDTHIRTWRRRQRLDIEQKGILWSESPF